MTLSSVMSNASDFLPLASQGNFTALASSLPDQSNYLYFAFNTYLISQTLSGNKVYGVMARETNPQAMATNGTKLNYGIDCQGYDEQNVCNAWRHSKRLQSHESEYGHQITDLSANFTTGQLLFKESLACNAEGNFGQPVNITVNAAGVNTACISQLRILTWNMSCTYPRTGYKNRKCEFLKTLAQPNFLHENAHAVTAQSIVSVPAGYLGLMIT